MKPGNASGGKDPDFWCAFEDGEGAASLRAIAAGLEDRGIPAARGGKWSAVQVARLLENVRLEVNRTLLLQCGNACF
jgi:hypothetical protein